ncbi:ABC transporter B family member 29, chloroplastic isoform X2 [Ziziphus jujuba]|uniref:ABC transporter B family member 29, chloroplastic isoform X2 n=1 Tax=Ziziphus jujuba TaxID=326968 RepID=A0A6P4AQA7_ZIZJJ|nr:ABC transporter B family member 29, chloroplastic isoform X2 [Ziziphus jujuba]
MSIIHLPFPPSQPVSLKFKPLFYLPTCPKLKLPLATSFKPFCSSKVPSYIPSEPTTQNSHFLSQTFHSLNSLKPYVLSQRTPILFGWLCSLVSVYSLSKVVANIGKASAFMGNFDGMRLRSEGSVLALLVLARHVASYWQQAFLWDAALSAVYEIRVQVFNKVLERDLAFFEGSGGVSAGDIAHRITSEASDVADTVYALLNTIVPSTLQLIAMGMQMLAISPLLSLISATVIPCMALVIAHLGEKLRKISKDAHLAIASISAYLNEILPAILSVKVNNAELCENVRFQMLARADLSAHLKKRKMKALVPQIIQILYFGALCILFAGSLAISRGSFDSCSMVSFLTSLVFLIEPIQGVGRAYNELKQVEPAIERLFDMTRFKSMVMENQDAADLNHVAGELQFCDISFKYADNMPLVLNKLNLHIKAGETVALVGPSGGGKTTLAKLLLRLYDPSSGCIFIDGHNIQCIRLQSLRRHVSLVSQDIMLFSGTVAENIGYRDLMKNIDMERVEKAAQTANVDEFIRKLPEGYKTNIGPRGSALSRGQKQRLAIARALYQNSSILILDEATSSLDSRSELLVRQAVERLMENHTVLVIAHRLETIKMAKRVFILDDGRLEELTPSTFLTSQYESVLSTGIVI